MIKRRQRRVMDIAVTQSGGVFSETIDLDKSIIKILGLVFTSDRDDLMYYRGTQRVEINKDEIYEQNYETKLLMTGIQVRPNDRYYEFATGVEPGNYKVKVDYKDNDNPQVAFAAYRVTLNLDVEISTDI